MPEQQLLYCADEQSLREQGRSRSATARYRLTIFLSAFLLFWVQLLLAKYILPWFGGAPAVWTTCMLFFQVLLLAGYAYAHILGTHFSSRAQSVLHSALILVSLGLIAFLMVVWNSAVTPDASWRPNDVDHPVWRIIVILTASAGIPYFILSSTGIPGAPFEADDE